MFFILPAQLPSLGVDWTTIVELRGRYERRDDADFTESLSDNFSTHLIRGRLGLEYELGPTTVGRVVYQFSSTDVEPTVGPGSDVTGQDLIEAHIVRRTDSSALTLGRQKLNVGGQRLVGATEWANSSRSWLGARFETGQWQFFWGELEVNPTPNAKAQIALASRKGALGETTLIYKHDAAPAMVTSLTTLDHRLVRSVGGTTLAVEGAYQWGRKGGLDHEAWAATARADVGMSPTMTLFVEANIATGGASAATGHTFDNLYPTNHMYYGMMDLQGWSNLKGFAVGASWRASTALSLEASYHDFSLYDETDGWYGAGGAINRRGGVPYIDPTGASGSRVGSEVDLLARYRLSSDAMLEGGVAVFTPGEFVKSFIGGPTTESTFGYLQVSLRF